MLIRNKLNFGSSEIEPVEPVVMNTDFRTLAWDSGSKAVLVVLAIEPADVYVKTVTLTGPNGEPQTINEIDREFLVRSIIEPPNNNL